MKPSLVLKMGQQLTMTPQLQQAIRLLQLSTLDLQQEIQEALESNPMLERQEDGEDFDNSDPMADNAENKPAAEVQDNSFQESTVSADNLEDGEWSERIPNELPVDTAWEDIYQTSASSLPSNDDDEWDFTTRTSAGESLQSHLLWQLNLAPMSDTDRLIAVTLIDSINGQGYLEDTLEEICAGFRPGAGYRTGRGRSGTAPHPAVRAGWRWRPQPRRMPVAATAPAARYNSVDDRSQAPGHRFHRPARQP